MLCKDSSFVAPADCFRHWPRGWKGPFVQGMVLLVRWRFLRAMFLPSYHPCAGFDSSVASSFHWDVQFACKRDNDQWCWGDFLRLHTVVRPRKWTPEERRYLLHFNVDFTTAILEKCVFCFTSFASILESNRDHEMCLEIREVDPGTSSHGKLQRSERPGIAAGYSVQIQWV